MPNPLDSTVGVLTHLLAHVTALTYGGEGVNGLFHVPKLCKGGCRVEAVHIPLFLITGST
ncbi:hypothetical protein ACPB9E_16435 [Streptomyces exfoliatus]|uniref:hypothetical protein n=1 Tax=Streptomyces exfoliatus TaxID=1905 RepID=UPI003C2D4310